MWHHKFKFRKKKYTAGHVAIVVLAFFTPLLLGTPLIFWQAEKTLYKKSDAASRTIIDQLNTILDDAKTLTDETAAMVDRPCSEIIEKLRLQTASTSFVQSLSVSDRDIVRCSTIYGNSPKPLDVPNFYQDKLALVQGNSIIPDRPVLMYRTEKDSASILASINGEYITQLLNNIEMTPISTVVIGNQRIGRNGLIRANDTEEKGKVCAVDTSTKYPFTVETGFEPGDLRDYVFARYTPIFGLLLVFGGISAFATHRMAMNARNISAESRRAIKNDEFAPYYQPIVRADTHQYVGAEVLSRWEHPLEGIIPPDNFIPFMERSGLIIPMTTALIRRTARELAPLQDALPENFHISINISANFLADPELIATCKQFYQQFRTGKIRLVLELTEREAIVPTEALQSQIRALRAEGILIALDDFGVGHSNLNYLKEFQADILKIDRGFITGIGSNDLSCHVLQSIIDLSRQLKLKVIAEGIETLEQANYLQEKGVEYLQGYYFSKPQPIAVFKTQINKANT